MSELARGALRSLRRRPALSAAVVATLAVAIGATTAVWSLVERATLRPLPYPEPERLVAIGALVPGQSELQEVSWPKFEALAAEGRALATTAAYYATSVGLTEAAGPRPLAAARVSERFFDVLGVAPRLGRTFSVDEQRAESAAVALVSDAFWRGEMAAAPDVVGRTLDLDGRATTVVGVMPASLRFPFRDVEVWLPRPEVAPFLPPAVLERGAGYLQLLARLAPGVETDTARRGFARISERYGEARPEQYDRAYSLAAVDWTERLVGPTRRTLFVLLAAVGLVLAVAAADVANLLLVDGLGRRAELAVRAALGASSRRLAAELAAEAALLAGAGGAAGVALAAGALALLTKRAAVELPGLDGAALSPLALGLALLVTAGTGAAALLLPLLRGAVAAPAAALGGAGRAASPSRRRARWQGGLVGAQIALALVLVSSAVLLVRSVRAVERLELGFAPQGLLLVEANLAESSYPTPSARRALFDAWLERVRGSAGIVAAALAEYPPAVGAPHTRVAEEGSTLAAAEEPIVQRLVVSDGYFATMGARWLAGRDFEPRRAAGAPPAAVVSRSLRELLFAGRDPIGRRLRIRGSDRPVEIVGVVDDLRQQPLELEFEPTLYLALDEIGDELSPPTAMTLIVRARDRRTDAAAAVRAALHALAPAQPLAEAQTVTALLRQASNRRRFAARLLSGFALAGVALALFGVHGVASHAVASRRRELAVRAALGADPRRLGAELLRRAGRWILPGLAVGAAGALAAGRLLASELYGGLAVGPVHVALAALAVAAVATTACVVPARRAAGLRPAATLRGE